MSNAQLDAQLEKAIVTATPRFMDVVSGHNPEVKRDAGLTATTRDIRTIRKFVDYANTLPSDLAQVKHLLGYETSHIPGLSPSAIRQLYLNIKNRVEYWPALENKMKDVGTGLIVTADNLEEYGQGIIDFVKGIEGYEKARLTLGDVSDKELASLPDIALPAAGAAKIGPLLSYVDDIVAIIEEQQAETIKMKTLFTELKAEFRTIESDVGIKLKLSAPTKPDGTLDEIAENLQNINVLIEEEMRTYDKFTSYQWIGAWWGLVGLAISWSIYGDDAANSRHKLDSLRTKKATLLNNQQATSAVMASMARLQSDLQNLHVRLADATASTAHLESLWLVILMYIEQSKKQLAKSNSATLLHFFVTRLNIMIKNWKLVKPDAQKLVDALDDAINE